MSRATCGDHSKTGAGLPTGTITASSAASQGRRCERTRSAPSMADERMTEDEPHDVLTGLCEVAIDALQADPRWQREWQIIVLVDTPEKGGIGMHGYESNGAAA